MTVYNSQPEQLVADLQATGSLHDPRYEAAFRQVDRRRFLPEHVAERAYHDCSVILTINENKEVSATASRPSTLIGLLDLLQLEPGMRVLEIGTGTGYFSALMRYLLGEHGQLVTLEIDPQLAGQAQQNLGDQVQVLVRDGAVGYTEGAPYDRIVSTAAFWDVPEAWLQQLRPGGWIVAPVFLDGVQVSGAFHVLQDGSVGSSNLMPSSFASMRGKSAGPLVRKRIGSTSMSVIADDVEQFDAVSLATLLMQDYESMQLSYALDSERYWHGFVPYLMISEVPDQIFALYHVEEGLSAFGIEGEGFALLTPASACFIPYYGNGQAHNFAGADAFLQVEQHLKNWQLQGQPGLSQLRLQFCPKRSAFVPDSSIATIYSRRKYDLHVWMETM